MKILSETADVFRAVKHAPGNAGEGKWQKALRGLAVGSVIRIKDHPHSKQNKYKCNAVTALYEAGKTRQMALSTRHDGPDLLVMRVR